MQKINYFLQKYDGGTLLGFATGIFGWLSSDLFLQFVGAIAAICGCVSSYYMMVKRLQEAKKSIIETENADLEQKILLKQLNK